MKDTMKILHWHFDGVYSIYNNDIEKGKVYNIIRLADSDDAFFVYNESSELVGNCEFYRYNNKLCVGLQMKPEMTGEGLGTEFVKAIIDFGKEKYNISGLNLYVAKFNKRAIRVYEKVGFRITEQLILKLRGKDYGFIGMRIEF